MPADTPSDKAGEQAKWRALAAEARACAAAMSEPRARRIMRDIAAAYELLAERQLRETSGVRMSQSG